MKKILLSMMLFVALGTTVKTFSQVNGCAAGTGACDIAVSGVEYSIVGDPVCNFDPDGAGPLPPDPNKTQVTFNLKFKLTSNSGNKWVFLHAWLQNDYPTVQPAPSVSGFFPCGGGATDGPDDDNGGKLPTSIGQAGRAFLNIGLDNGGAVALNQTVNVPVLTSYAPDADVALNTGMTVTKTRIATGVDSFTLSNVTIVINQACNTPVFVKADVWSTNANSVGKAQCWVAGITQSFNDPTITVSRPCVRPRTYGFGIVTANSTPTTLTYSVYIDVNGDGEVTNVGLPGGDIQLTAPTNYANFSSSNTFSTNGQVGYPPYASDPAYGDKDLIFLYKTPLIANTIKYIAKIDLTQCLGLPVNFKSFTAARNRSNVLLKWETTTEVNSAGFSVQRNIGGTWQEIAYVPSQAPGGNSDALLTYTFNDLNNTKGITQYRIKQVDLDGKSKLSDVRAVRGEGQIGKTIVYPNPSNTGNVSIVFEDANVKRDVSVIDMTGKIIKQWRNVTNNNLQVENLPSGVFSVRILAIETGEQVVEKIVVNKR